MTKRNSNSHIPIILGTISILITTIGLLIWLTASLTPTEQVTIEASNEETIEDEPPTTTIIVEEQPALTDLNFLLPLLLTTFGALTSFGALVIEWSKNRRDAQDDDLMLRVQKIDLELKKLQLQKLRRELDGDPPAAT